MSTRRSRVLTFAARLCACAVLVSLVATAASATTYTISAGNGTLSFTSTTSVINCQPELNITKSYLKYAYSGFSYTESGTTMQLSGTDTAIDDLHGGEGNCPPSNFPTIVFTVLSAQEQIEFTPTFSGSGSTKIGYMGYVDPKFLLVGVTYAPPGPSVNTFVQYMNSTYVGSTETISNSFTGSNTESISL